MRLNRFNERIWFTDPQEETDRPVLYYIKGDRYSLAVDAGNSALHVQEFYQLLKKEELKLPDFTVITHWHWDHTFGMHAVEGITIAGHKTNEKLREVKKWSWTDTAMQERIASGEDILFCDQCIRREYEEPRKIQVVTADLEFVDRMVIDLGNITCELTEIEATHMRDSVILFVPEEKFLFVGDADCEDHYTNGGKYDKVRLQEFVKNLKEIPFTYYGLGHEPPQTREEAFDYLETELAKLSKEL